MAGTRPSQGVLSGVAVEGLAGHNAIDFWYLLVAEDWWLHFKHTGENVLEGKFNVASVKGRGLDEGEIIVACLGLEG